MLKTFAPGIDQVETGRNIKNLRLAHGLTVKDVQDFFNFDAPQAIYKWERGATLPNLDNLAALSDLYDVLIDDILVRVGKKAKILSIEQKESARCPKSYLDAQHSIA